MKEDKIGDPVTLPSSSNETMGPKSNNHQISEDCARKKRDQDQKYLQELTHSKGAWKSEKEDNAKDSHGEGQDFCSKEQSSQLFNPDDNNCSVEKAVAELRDVLSKDDLKGMTDQEDEDDDAVTSRRVQRLRSELSRHFHNKLIYEYTSPPLKTQEKFRSHYPCWMIITLAIMIPLLLWVAIREILRVTDWHSQ